MKKDGDKGKKTLSGKKPATFGGENSKLLKSKPKEKSIMFSKGPAPKMNAEATGERNWDKSSSPRASVSVGPATINMGGRTAKSKGGMNMTGGKVLPKKSVNPTAKTSGLISKGDPKTTVTNNYPDNNVNPKFNKNNAIAIGAGLATVGTGVMLAGGGKKLKQAAKYIGDTKNRKARKRAQKAENDAMLVERKAKAEAKNPSTPVGKNSKISKRTRSNMNRLKKG